MHLSLKRICCYFDKLLITSCNGCCQFFPTVMKDMSKRYFRFMFVQNNTNYSFWFTNQKRVKKYLTIPAMINWFCYFHTDYIIQFLTINDVQLYARLHEKHANRGRQQLIPGHRLGYLRQVEFINNVCWHQHHWFMFIRWFSFYEILTHWYLEKTADIL